eukprot:10098894-Prorocentrum_lima.AAC.1
MGALKPWEFWTDVPPSMLTGLIKSRGHAAGKSQRLPSAAKLKMTIQTKMKDNSRQKARKWITGSKDLSS